MQRPNRRQILLSALAGSAALAATGLLSRRASATDPVVVIGGGPAGAGAALALRAARPGQPVLLVERDPTRLAAPAEARDLAALLRPAPPADHSRLAARGVGIVLDDVTEVDWRAGRLGLFSGRRIAFSTLVLAPGTAPRPEAIPGYDAVARHAWPAAWGSLREARRLSGQLAALPEAGHVVLRLPADAGGTPAAAADRALWLARLLQQSRPAARLTVLDADPSGAAGRLFAASLPAPARVTWLGATEGGRVVAVDARRGTIETDAGTLHADVVNFVAPQGAAEVAQLAGLVDASGWCPCDAAARSQLNPAAVVIGDARKGALRTFSAALDQGLSAARTVLPA